MLALMAVDDSGRRTLGSAGALGLTTFFSRNSCAFAFSRARRTTNPARGGGWLAALSAGGCASALQLIAAGGLGVLITEACGDPKERQAYASAEIWGARPRYVVSGCTWLRRW